jgi:hypothetical protein
VSARTVFRRVVYVMAGGMVVVAGLVLHLNGQIPARVPADAPAYKLTDLVDALRAVDARGQIDLTELKKRHASLETFVASLAATSPALTPDAFPTVEARLAYWLNAFHALALLELLDTRSSTTSAWREAFDAVPIGGRRLTRLSIYRSVLSQSGDARVFLSIFTGAKGRGVLDGAPFDPESINLQLDDSTRRFMQRRDHFAIDGKTVKLSELFLKHRDEFLAALPDERKNVLQIVWAYLPETCAEDKPGCDTRGDLDRACGNHFDACQIVWLPVDETLAVKN